MLFSHSIGPSMKEIELTEADFVAGNELAHSARTYLVSLTAVGIFWLLTFVYGFLVSGDVAIARLITIGLILMTGFYIFARFSVKNHAKKIFAQVSFLRKPYIVGITPGGQLTISYENHVTEIPRNKVVKLKKNSDLILIFISDIHMFLVPRRYFDDQKQFEDFFATVKRYYGK